MFVLKRCSNEVNSANHEPKGDANSYEKGDMSTKRNMARGPASFVAAGKAMQEPNITHVSARASRFSTPSVGNGHSMSDLAQKRQPFKKTNKPLPPLVPVDTKISTPMSTTSTHTISPPARSTLSINTKSPPAMSASSISTISPPAMSASSISTRSPPATFMDKSSKMSDHNMFKPGPNVQPNLSEKSSCGQLHAFTLEHNLQPPVFKTFAKFCPATKVTSYMCKVKLGSSLSFTSCPYESQFISEVQGYTAKLALDELKRRYENLDSQALPITTNENDIIKRVADIVNPHSNGVKCELIETEYKILYQQILPLDWLDIIKNRSLLSVEELVGGNIAVYPIEGISVNSDVSKLPPLVLPENEVWNIYVTCCTSTSCLYFRIIHDDYNDRFAAMDETMTELYTLKKDELKSVDIVKEGSYYAAYLDKSWFRVKALSTIIEGFVRVSLIDHGDVDEVRKEHLYPLDERFTNVPPQKVSCSITGLEEFSKESYVTKILYDLTCGKVFVAKVDSRNPQLQLTLLDTSTEIDVNVNELILDRIDKELSPPKIPSKNGFTDAYLISITEDGSAFVQIISESLKLLKSFLAEASQELATDQEKYCLRYTSDLVGNKIFLAKCATDGQWHRVLVVRVISEEEVEVLFVDYGNSDFVRRADIADVKHFTEALAIMPHQAVQVRLVKPNDELFTENVIRFVMDLSSPKDNGDATRYLLKTVKEGIVADVGLFVRLPETNELVNLNEIIASYYVEYRGPNHTSVKLSIANSIKPLVNSINQFAKVPESRLLVALGFRNHFTGLNPLTDRNRKKDAKSVLVPVISIRGKNLNIMERACPIPISDVPVGQQFNVYVTMVSSPFNFIVQPHEYRSKLANLMAEMNDFYEKEQPLVDVSKVQEDEAYAVKTDSGKWYRGIVVKVLSGLDCISMKLIDYGDIVSIKFSNLAHLLPCFRELSRQAVKAELAGISPLHRDWSVEDSLRFKNLVSQKVMISVVVDVHKDGKIIIILYDTSTDEEVDIGAVLVEEGRAKDITQ